MSLNISKLERGYIYIFLCIYTYIYIYICICIYMYIYIYKSHTSLLSLIAPHSLRPSIFLLSPSKLAFHYSFAWEIFSCIMPVTSANFLYNYSKCNLSIKESRYPYRYTHFRHSQMTSASINEKKQYCISCCLNMADDWIQPYQIMQTIWNYAECCDDFGSISFICYMSMKDSIQLL